MKSERGDLAAHASTAETKKKQYITPKLVVHGSVEKITEQDGTAHNKTSRWDRHGFPNNIN